jgi:hypothetical protein
MSLYNSLYVNGEKIKTHRKIGKFFFEQDYIDCKFTSDERGMLMMIRESVDVSKLDTYKKFFNEMEIAIINVSVGSKKPAKKIIKKETVVKKEDNMLNKDVFEKTNESDVESESDRIQRILRGEAPSDNGNIFN